MILCAAVRAVLFGERRGEEEEQEKAGRARAARCNFCIICVGGRLMDDQVLILIYTITVLTVKIHTVS